MCINNFINKKYLVIYVGFEAKVLNEKERQEFWNQLKKKDNVLNLPENMTEIEAIEFRLYDYSHEKNIVYLKDIAEVIDDFEDPLTIARLNRESVVSLQVIKKGGENLLNATDKIFHILEEAFLTKTLDDWSGRLNEAGLPWAPLQTLPEVIADPQARADDFFIPYDHPSYGRIELVANPVKLNRTPAPVRMPAPGFAQHTVEVLLECGYTEEDIEQFKQQQIVA